MPIEGNALIVGGPHSGDVVTGELRPYHERTHEIGGPSPVPIWFDPDDLWPETVKVQKTVYKLTQLCSAADGDYREYMYFYIPARVTSRIESLYAIRTLWDSHVEHTKLNRELKEIGYYD